MAPRTRRRLEQLGLLVLVWTCVGLFNAGGTLIRPRPGARSAWEITWRVLLSAYTWAAFTPLVLRLCKRFPLHDSRRTEVQAAHAVAFLAIPIAQITANYLAFNWILREEVGWIFFVREEYLQSIALLLPACLLTYSGILGAAWLIERQQLERHRRIVSEQLKRQLADARMRALRMQLHPHFLFNTLNTILPLLYRDADTAARTVVQLGDLVRQSLKNDAKTFVSLRAEVSFLERYLQIEETRFRDRLTVHILLGRTAENAAVPSLILQPLVENAVRHGISARPGPGRIEILGRREGDRLLLDVRDDGPGLPDASARREGVGVANTVNRLKELYGDDHRFVLQNRSGGGTEAMIDIPFRPAPERPKSSPGWRTELAHG